ncbi:MAG: hypothetical protein KDC95_15435 [Planctomycetes bacterium]|nr:hypothetical protein [Planctomycetota bacterium]
MEHARSTATLAAWESFLKSHPRSPARVEACEQIEARLDEAVPIDRARAAAARDRFEKQRAEDPDSNKRLMAIDVFRLAEPDAPSRVWMKTKGGEFVALEGGPVERAHPAEPSARAFDEPTLRFLPAEEHLVIELRESDLLGEARSLERTVSGLWFAATKHAGLDFSQTRLTIALREKRDFDGVAPAKGNPARMQRRLIDATITPEQLLSRLERVPDEHLDWACAVVGTSDVSSRTAREKTMLAIATRTAPDDLDRTDGTRAVALDLAAGERDEIGIRACRFLAMLDPSGKVFEESNDFDGTDHEARERVVARLSKAIEADGAIAATIDESPLAVEARALARSRLLARFSIDDEEKTDDALLAGTQLQASDPRAFTTAQRVRLAALSDSWEPIRELRGDAIVPLLRLFATRQRIGPHSVADVLASIGNSCPPVPEASELLLTDGRLRAHVLAASPALGHLFTGEARAYLEACIDPDRLAEFAARTPNARWADLAKAWTNDAAGRDLLELVEEGKLGATSHGAGLFAVRTTLENRCDHELRIRITPGLRFDSQDTAAQNMVVTKKSEVVLAPAAKTSISISAACANHRRAIPRQRHGFALSRVAPTSELARALAILGQRDNSRGVAQAVVWILTDDVRHKDLEQVQRVRLGSTRGPRVISNTDILDAFVILETAGVDLTKKRIWADRRRIREHHDGWSHPWYTKWVEGK